MSAKSDKRGAADDSSKPSAAPIGEGEEKASSGRPSSEGGAADSSAHSQGGPSQDGVKSAPDLDQLAKVIDDMHETYGSGPVSGHQHYDPTSVKEWYESARSNRRTDADWEETIGLFGGRNHEGDQYHLNRRSKFNRLREMVGIVRKYDIFHGLTPVSFREMLEELGPTFVKAGQILSMRSEILPESFCQELTKLRAQVEPMDRDLVLSTLRAEYDKPIEEIFDAIDDVPLGSASVAQVHKAKLVTGELVAVKVQRPHVQETMAQDIDIIRSLAKHASRIMGDEQFLDLQSVVEELWQSFREETDFLVEARNLEEFRRNNADVKFISCPKPYLKLCTQHVVVMDYVKGIPISDTARLEDAGYDLEEIGTKLIDNYTKQMLDDGFFHADPHPGNLIISGGKIVYIDLGITGRLSAHDRGAMRDIVFAVGERDSARLKDGLLRFAVGDNEDVDHAHLLADIDTIVADYGTAELHELDLAGLVNAVIQLARRNDIELPGSVTMLARSLITLEGVIDEFIPGVSMVEIVSNHIKHRQTPGEALKGEARLYATEAHKATHGLLKAASQADLAMSMLTRGQLRMNLDLPGTDNPIADFSHAFDRLTMGIIIAGLFIGSSVIYYARIQPVVFGIPIVGFVGFFVALVLGVWVIISIMREGKHRSKRG